MAPDIDAFAAAAALFVALATLQIGLFVWLRADMRRLEMRFERGGERLRADLAGLDERLRAEIAGSDKHLRAEMAGLEERLRAEIAGSEEHLRAEIAGLESRTNERFERLEARMDGRFERLEARMAAMEHGQAKLEGLLEGLREAIAGRKDAA